MIANQAMAVRFRSPAHEKPLFISGFSFDIEIKLCQKTISFLKGGDLKNKMEIEEISICPECGSKRLIKDSQRAEIVCQDCGLVVEDDIADRGLDFRAFDHDTILKKAHTGGPESITMHDKGLTTAISNQNKDALGQNIPKRERSKCYRLRKWQKRTRVSNATERNLITAFQEIGRIVSLMNLPQIVRESASFIYRKAQEKRITRGRSIKALAATTVYAACRQTGRPRTLDEIVEVTGLQRKEIGAIYRHLKRHLELNITGTSPQAFINRLCGKLKLGNKTKEDAVNITSQVLETKLTIGRNPMSISAAAVYIAAKKNNELITQRDVAEEAGITEVTIRNTYKPIIKELDISLEI